MKITVLILSAAAGIAGWLGASWFSATDGAGRKEGIPSVASSPQSPDSCPALRRFSASGQGSGRLAELAVLLRRAPLSELPALLAAVEKWPLGTARDMALALIHCRQSPELTDAAGPPEGEAPVNEYRALADALAAGGAPPDWQRTLLNWAAFDPTAACASVLKMPPGEVRYLAVDKITAALANDDPAAAMAFALESGENRLGAGAAGAWMRLALTDRSDFAEALKKITPRMSGIQQDSLAAALANSLAASRESGGSDAGKEETDIWRINLAVSEWAWSPGKETLQTELSRRSTALSGVRSGAGMIPDAFPEHAILLATMLEKRLQEQPDQVLEQLSAMDESTPNPELRPAVFNRAAPHILPQLCRTGHVAEAVQLLDKVHDSGAWRQSFQAMLPYWMDVDPAAARAAFDAAPLTALERERWQQHPVFLLHP